MVVGWMKRWSFWNICFKVFSCDLRVLWLDGQAFCNTDCDGTTAPSSHQHPLIASPRTEAQSRSLLGSGDEAYLTGASWLLPFKYRAWLSSRDQSFPQCMHDGFPVGPGKEREGNPMAPEVVTLPAFQDQGTHCSWPTKTRLCDEV